MVYFDEYFVIHRLTLMVRTGQISRILFSKLTKRALNIFYRRMGVIGYACTQLCLVGWEWKLAVMQIVITLEAGVSQWTLLVVVKIK